MEFNIEKLRKFVAPEFIFGFGARKMAGRSIANLGVRKILFVTDPGLDQASWADEMRNLFRSEKIPFVQFADVSPNPRDEEVMRGAHLFQTENCEAIVALGGGSAMDCAKGVGVVASNGGHILDYEGVDQAPVPCPPLIFIPSTAGTAADLSQFCIVTNTQERYKIAIISKGVVPDLALIDPEITTTMSPELTANTGMDALTHAMEALVSTAGGPITDLHALEAARLVKKHIAGAVFQPDNPIHREGMMLASLQAGLAFSNASLGLVHAMAHSLGGFLDLPHGLCNAVLLPLAVETNFKHAANKYRLLAGPLEIAGNSDDDGFKNLLIRFIRELQRQIGVPCDLKQFNIQPQALRALSQKAVNDPCMLTNPFIPTVSDVEELYARIA